jgi:hypothetical protein
MWRRAGGGPIGDATCVHGMPPATVLTVILIPVATAPTQSPAAISIPTEAGQESEEADRAHAALPPIRLPSPAAILRLLGCSWS